MLMSALVVFVGGLVARILETNVDVSVRPYSFWLVPMIIIGIFIRDVFVIEDLYSSVRL